MGCSVIPGSPFLFALHGRQTKKGRSPVETALAAKQAVLLSGWRNNNFDIRCLVVNQLLKTALNNILQFNPACDQGCRCQLATGK